MRLFNIIDNSNTNYDDPWGVAVWAHSEGEALAYASDRYVHGYGAPPEACAELRPDNGSGDVFRGVDPLETGAHEETRPEVLRLIGWHEGGEDYCSRCDMASMGLPQYAVCQDCDNCRKCATSVDDEEDRCHCVNDVEGA